MYISILKEEKNHKLTEEVGKEQTIWHCIKPL